LGYYVGAIAQLALSSPIIIGWRVRSWA